MYKKVIGIIVGILLIYSIKTSCFAANGEISFQILAGPLQIGSIGNISLPLIAGSSQTGNIAISGSNNFFQIWDRKTSCEGFYTSLQGGNLSDGINTISAQYLSIQHTTPIILDGYENPAVLIPSGINTTVGLQTPKTFYKREKNTGCTIISKYGSTPTLSISIPANQATGTYRAKLYYLLIDQGE